MFSMRGSGIDSYEVDMEVSCEGECPFNGEVEVHIDDWGTGHWQCPECGEDREVDDRP